MDYLLVLKAISEESRMKILTLLLQYNYCVRALARKLNLSEAAVSQHLKVLREAGLLVGEKRGYFMHYDVNRHVLYELSVRIEEMAATERKTCNPPSIGTKGEKWRGHCDSHKSK
ncbi:MAG: ArsR/SmtB family transcription factor [bacterium]|jgi:ArsR family transcriptional regulator